MSLFKLLNQVERLLLIGLVILVLGICLQSLHSAIDYQVDAKNFTDAYHENVTSLSTFHTLNSELAELRLQLSSYASANPEQRADIRKARIVSKQKFDLAMKKSTENLQSCVNEQDRLSAFNEFKISFEKYWYTQAYFFELVDQNRIKEAWDYRSKITNPAAIKADKILDQILEDENEEAEDQAKQINSRFAQNSYLNWLTAIALTIFSSGLACWLTYMVIKAKYELSKSNFIHDNRLAIIAKSTASITHEINTPLTIMSGKIDLLLKKSETADLQSDKIKTDLQAIQKHTNRVLKISQGLRVFSRREESR